jgi:endonuclease/exonuclease/phosphatase family metal-dependent hydrolase
MGEDPNAIMKPAERLHPVARRALGLAAVLLALHAPPAHALRVVTWNLAVYDDAAVPMRRPWMIQVLPGLDPDVMVVQEMHTSEAADSFASLLRAAMPAKVWKGGTATFLSTTESAIYYDSLQVTISNLSAVATGGPRQVLVALVRPRGYLANAASFRIYSIHFKAGNGAGGASPPSDSSTRTLECTNLRNTLNLAPAGTNILMGGDTNFYGSFETGYTRLTESQADNDGRLKDNLSMPGIWNNPAYAPYHTQSPCAGLGCLGSNGGMDDRFDMVLGTYSMNDGAGLDLVPGALPGGYGPYGNDGQHYNQSIDGGGFNLAVPLAVATALRLSSDHLPVIATLQLPAKLATVSELSFGDVLVGATATQDLSVDDAPAPPAASLQYSLTAPAGFTAPSGTFTNAAASAPDVRTLGLSTGSIGVRTGTLTVNSNDLDTTAKAVLLSGRVLAHAAPTLDSTVSSATATLDFGTVVLGSHTERSLRVFNLGYSSLQARLARSAEFVAGESRFAFQAQPGLITDVATDAVTFDATGATPDADYQAELRIATADEPLPGALALDTLRVALHAKVSATDGVAGLPTVLRFTPPAPNPFSRNTMFSFDLPHDATVSLAVYDASGRRVADLAHGDRSAGHYQLRWQAAAADGSPLGAGLYFARFSTRGLTRVARLVLLP